MVLAMTGQAQNVVTVPAANTASGQTRSPWGSYFGYEGNQMLYTQSEIGTAGIINAVGFYLENGTGSSPVPAEMYMYETTDAQLSSIVDFPAKVAQGTLVWAGTIDLANVPNNSWHTINLNTPFLYSGGANLVIITRTAATGAGNEGSTAKAYRYGTATGMNIRWVQDDFPIDASTTGTLNGNRPNVQLSMAALGADLSLARIVSPSSNGVCGPVTNAPIRVVVRNTGQGAVTDYDVAFSINGGAPYTISRTTTLAQGASDTITFPQTFSASTPGTYRFTSSVTTNPADAVASNNTRVDSAVIFGPWSGLVNFANYNGNNLPALYPGWREATGATATGLTSDWVPSTAAQVTALGKTGAKINLFSANYIDWIISRPFLVQANETLELDAAILDYNGVTSSDMGSDDSVFVKISTDCGTTWNTIHTWSLANQPVSSYTKYTFSLAAFAGQTVQLGIMSSEGTVNDLEDYDFQITDIFVGVPPVQDVSLSNLTVSGCGVSANSQASVTIKNTGINPASNIPVYLIANGGTPIVETAPGPIAPGQSATYTFNSLPNITAAGTYNLVAYSMLSGDPRPQNDSAKTRIVNGGPWTTPVTFAGFTGANLSDVEAGWEEKTGRNPTGTTSGWNSAAAAVQTALGTTTAKLNLFVATSAAWLISKPFFVNPGQTVKFDAAVTAYNSPNARNMGSDDSVRVMASTDCGATWTMMHVFTQDSVAAGNLTNTLKTKVVDIARFAGQSIRIAFFGTDGPVDDTEDWDFHVTNITLDQKLPNDLRPQAIASNIGTCDLQNQFVPTITVYNNGINPQTSFEVGYRINNGPVVTQSVNQNIDPGQSATIQVGQPVNLSARGTYVLKAWTSLSGDQIMANDTTTRTLVRYVSPTPLVTFEAPFTGRNIGVYPDYRMGSGANGSDTTRLFSRQIAGGSGVLAVDLAGNNRQFWLISPSVRVDGNNQFLLFRAGSTGALDADDALEVRISNDCGQNWNTISTFSGTSNPVISPNGLTQFNVSLAQYTGSDIRFALVAVDGTTGTTKRLLIDDVEVRSVNNIDASIIELVTPPCGEMLAGQTYPILVRVRNVGIQPMSGATISGTIGSRSYMNASTVGSIPSGATQDVSVGLYTVPTAVGSTVDVNLYITLNGDQQLQNDTLRLSCTVSTVAKDAAASRLQVYPNPTTGNVFVKLPNTMNGNQLVSVTSLDGRTVFAGSLVTDAENKLNLNLTGLTKGVYFLQVGNSEGALRQRLVIE